MNERKKFLQLWGNVVLRPFVSYTIIFSSPSYRLVQMEHHVKVLDVFKYLEISVTY